MTGNEVSMLNEPTVTSSKSSRDFASRLGTALTSDSITINAAFLQEIKQDNVQFRDIVHEITSFVQIGAYLKSDTSVLVKHIKELRDQLATHFALEETYGYFACPLNVPPELSQRVERVRAEHDEIRIELTDILNQALQLNPVSAAGGRQTIVLNRLRHLLERLDAHERRENELIQRAFNDDVGGAG
jgi:iron-sulfur cluster repair protein YtfE (RIC family)